MTDDRWHSVIDCPDCGAESRYQWTHDDGCDVYECQTCGKRIHIDE